MAATITENLANEGLIETSADLQIPTLAILRLKGKAQ